ncbi:MAG TPA: hypothetical protein VLX92_27205 [Kofleriaceae bacterium]|nr:hypothetical protein [Kofleriaceae bacterium]
MSKTETPNPSSARPEAAPDPFSAFDPAAAWAAYQQTFHKMMGDAQARAKAFNDEYAALEAQMMARARAAIDSWAQLAQEALVYAAQLSARARELGIETARKVGVGFGA